MKKKLLIYAHYYTPDVASTGQILQDLAEGMKDDFDVTVICTVPSYGGKIKDEYKANRFYRETINGVNVIRVPVSEFTKSSKISRIFNLTTYFFNTRRLTKKLGGQDYIFALSQPPILGGMLGVYGKKKLKSRDGKTPKFIYNIQDFNPEQIEAVSYFRSRAAIAIMRWLDNRSCRNADLVITVGRDLEETLEKRFHGRIVPKHTMINNWIDEKTVYPLESNDGRVIEFKKKYGLDHKFVIMYSGNIGLYYDLEGLIKIAAQFKGSKTEDNRDVVFAFVGEGSVLHKLKGIKRQYNLNNVLFIPYQNKENLIFSLNAADVHLCVSAKGIKGVSCPSKFYGIASVGKPVIAVLEKGSEVRMLIEEIGCGRVSDPGDYRSFEENIRWFISLAGSDEIIEMGKKGNEYLINKLTKNISIRKYISMIKSL